jgi:hypothetical protein
MYKTDYLQNGAKRRDIYVDVVYHISPRAALALLLGVLLLGVLLLVLGLVAAASNPWNPPPTATISAPPAPAATSSSTTAPAASSIPPLLLPRRPNY